VFCDNGSCPSHSDALIISVMYGRSTSISSFSKNVRMGLSAHDLVADCEMSLRTSSSVHGDSSDSDTPGPVELDAGGCRPSVAARTVLTFTSKYSTKVSE